MNPPREAWAPWVYRLAMVVLSAYAMFQLVWLHFDLAWGEWGPETAAQRLEIVTYLALGYLFLLAINMTGLVARNLARIKAGVSRDGATIEVGSGGAPPSKAESDAV